jgi:hypothetical protein
VPIRPDLGGVVVAQRHVAGGAAGQPEVAQVTRARSNVPAALDVSFASVPLAAPAWPTVPAPAAVSAGSVADPVATNGSVTRSWLSSKSDGPESSKPPQPNGRDQP